VLPCTTRSKVMGWAVPMSEFALLIVPTLHWGAISERFGIKRVGT
jgi:hypothetical protein